MRRPIDPTGHLAAQFPELADLLAPQPPRRRAAALRRPRWLLTPAACRNRVTLRLLAMGFLRSYTLAPHGRRGFAGRAYLAALYAEQLADREQRGRDIATRGPWAALAL